MGKLILYKASILCLCFVAGMGFKFTLISPLYLSSWLRSQSNKIAETVLSDVNTLMEKIPPVELEKEFKNCQTTMANLKTLEEKLVKKGRVIRKNNRYSDLSFNRYRRLDPFVYSMEKLHLPFEEVTKKLIANYDITDEELRNDLPRYPAKDGLYKENRDSCTTAQPSGDCNANSIYRTANGRCNNLNNPTWGMAMTCQQRILPANYVGQSGFRQSVTGNPLPDPRTLSLNLHRHFNRPTNYVTHMYMFFGQLLDHDFALTPISTTIDNQPIECCPPEQETHPQCSPILISSDDEFYSQFGVTCLNFVRSAICPTCAMGLRQQMDQVTSFIDVSFLYGNADNETSILRANDGTGTLRNQRSNFGDLLPPSPNPGEDQCSFPETNDICFQAGDPRANQHTVLTSLHTIFMREHNRIARILRQLNPHWAEEQVFQETRRINGAQMQVITYKEYLPITLGPERMSYFKLWISGSGTTVYNPTLNPTMIEEFSTAAFRFGHSLINSVIAQTPLNSTNGRRLLRNEFFQPFDLYNGVIDPLMRGASDSPAQWFDRSLVPDVTNFLFRVRGNQTGLDLASININRGRDHGLPVYTDVVRFCSDGEIEIRSFSDLPRYKLMTNENAQALRRNYRSVYDIDLWPGILMEIPNENAVVGPTGTCLIGEQFQRLKYGDRFYFEHRGQVGSFTYQQRQELKRTSLSTIICLNTNTNGLPLNAMLFASRNNPRINCNRVTGIDLSYWRE